MSACRIRSLSRAGRGCHPQAAGGTAAREAIEQFAFEGEQSEPRGGQTMHRLVHRALRMIREDFSPSSWQAFLRTTVDGLTAAEVAEELGITTAAMRQAKYRVLTRLRELLADD